VRAAGLVREQGLGGWGEEGLARVTLGVGPYFFGGSGLILMSLKH